MVEPDNKFLHRRIDSLDFGKYLTARIINVCKYNTEYRMIDGKFTKVDEPIVTVADLAKRTEGELMRTPNLERRSVDAIKRMLAEHGLALAVEPTRKAYW
jgi:hypothetical protein